MNKKIYLCFLIWLVNYCNFPLMNATYSSPPSHSHVHSQCQGLDSVYDSHGNLNGYRGLCDVSRWDGQSPSLNSMHPIDMEMMSNSMREPGKFDAQYSSFRHHKNSRSPDKNFFDWLTPHHDIIRNHPHYRKAHFKHRQCIHEKKSGLFDFIGKLFDSGTKRNFDDPYLNLDKRSRCLNSEYYNNNPIAVGNSNFDPFAIDMGYNIQNIRNQMNTLNDTSEIERTRNNLHNHYDRLHRHLDCHCHHELADSRMHRVHHYPITDHSIQTLSYPDPDQTSGFPSQMNSTLPIDPSMDLEDEHAALMRMSGFASQNAYNLNQLDPNSSTLRMQMFHPVNSYDVENSNQNNYDDSDWNRLKIEKVIVIKRLKVPVVQKIPIPVPVPVPYPVTSAINEISGNNNGFNSDGGASELYNMPQGYLGDNTYMIDADDEDTSPIGMDSIVHAISGAPCNCFNQQDVPNEYNQLSISDSTNYPNMMQPASSIYNNHNYMIRDGRDSGHAHFQNIQTSPFDYRQVYSQQVPNNVNFTTPAPYIPSISMQPGIQLTTPAVYNNTNHVMSTPQFNQREPSQGILNNGYLQNSYNALIQPVTAINLPRPFSAAQNIAQQPVQ